MKRIYKIRPIIKINEAQSFYNTYGSDYRYCEKEEIIQTISFDNYNEFIKNGLSFIPNHSIEKTFFKKREYISINDATNLDALPKRIYKDKPFNIIIVNEIQNVHLSTKEALELLPLNDFVEYIKDKF